MRAALAFLALLLLVGAALWLLVAIRAEGAERYLNDYVATIPGAIGSADTSIVVSHGQGQPLYNAMVSNPGDTIHLKLTGTRSDTGGAWTEYISVSAVGGTNHDTLTAARGQDGSSAAPFAPGATLAFVVSNAILSSFSGGGGGGTSFDAGVVVVGQGLRIQTDGGAIINGSVTIDITDGSITNPMLADGSVGSVACGAGLSGGTTVLPGAASCAVATNGVTGIMLGVDAGSIGAVAGDASITGVCSFPLTGACDLEIASAGVQQGHLANNAVRTAQLGVDAGSMGSIAGDASITGVCNLPGSAVCDLEIASAGVQQGHIANNAVRGPQLGLDAGSAGTITCNGGLTGSPSIPGGGTCAVATQGITASMIADGGVTPLQVQTAMNNASSAFSVNSQLVQNGLTPVASTDLATKGYVDSTAQGLSVHQSVRMATTAALPTNTYTNLACLSTITETGFGALTVDGVAAAVNDRVLIKNEGTSANDGIYVVTIAGNGAASFVLTRATDMNQASEFPGAFVFVAQGTTNQSTGWVLSIDPDTTFTCGTTSQTWTQFSGAGDITATAPIAKSGNTISLNIGSGLGTTSNNLVVASNGIVASMVGIDAGSLGSISGDASITGLCNLPGSGTCDLEIAANGVATGNIASGAVQAAQLGLDAGSIISILGDGGVQASCSSPSSAGCTITQATNWSPTQTGSWTFNTNTITLGNISLPSAPSGTNLEVFDVPLANHPMLGFRNAGEYWFAGARWGGERLDYQPIAGNGTSITGEPYGFAATTTGPTLAHAAPSGTTVQASLNRLQITSGVSNNNFAELCSGSTNCNTTQRGIVTRGSATNVGGFFMMFMIATETDTANTSAFVGFRTAAGASTDPSAYTDEIGFGYTTSIGTSANWQFYRSASGSGAAVDLGSNCQRDTTSALQFFVYCPSNGSSCGYRAYNASTANLCADGSVSTTLPTNTVYLMLSIYMDTNGTTTAQTLDIFHIEGWTGIGAQ